MIDKLEYLIALANEQHFGRAAESCGVTQPTFSAGIKQLEETLGVLLVQRGSRFHSFTPEGERVLDRARRIVGDSRAMQQEIRALKEGLAGHIKIAAVPTALRAKITDRLAPGVVYTTFHHPNTQANVVTTDYSDWATNCPEYKVTAVQVAPSNGPTAWQDEYDAEAKQSRRIVHLDAAPAK
jgi:hypothetical protein